MLNDMETLLHGPNPARYQPGDMLTFEKADGLRWIVTILGTAKDGDMVLMAWDGLPHLLYASEDVLNRLRVVRIEHADPATLAEWRSYFRYQEGCEPIEMRVAA